ncbi:3D-(3,5/4)-trihydroxycyclohexane-1,2-dione acylhydrolase (decyclizing) [Dongia sp.]|uniref:3D-(3,5/4)-trihydroxycyclohexane-1,2-dione acylhydrolase (decyclizing) n=1 Tax=Dongia sp. TaxID=1977262 RepID=UPI0035B3070A
MKTIRLTMAQALLRYFRAQEVEIDGVRQPILAGMFAIFGHGNVAGLGEALADVADRFPTYRAQNEQAMAHAAIAFTKAQNRRRILGCTTSVGPGATNMVTAAAVAHVNRLPLLLLPGDIFANRRPDPVLQQIESFQDATLSANDCFKPVSRYWDRITRPEQLLATLPQAIRVLTDPVECGPVTLCLPQDVQTEAFDYPAAFFETKLHHWRRPSPDTMELAAALQALKSAKAPLVIAGGGVKYSLAGDALCKLVESYDLPLAETQAGKGVLPWDHPLQMGGVGVTGSSAANDLARHADCILAIGTRLQDFTTGSHALWGGGAKLIQLNTTPFDAVKQGALPLVADARAGIEALQAGLEGWKVPGSWSLKAQQGAKAWNDAVSARTAPRQLSGNALPSDAEVLGAVNRTAAPEDIMINAAGGMPGELHKLWRAHRPEGYHLEYGYSCMGYEIAGGLGIKLAHPDRRVIVFVGDGSYLMMNSEIVSSVMMGAKLDIVITDNSGFGCINRLQQACGGRPFNNLFEDVKRVRDVKIDFAAHAAAMGAVAEKVNSIADLEAALTRAKGHDRTSVIVIDTDPLDSTPDGGAWWDVPVPEVSTRAQVDAARAKYEKALTGQK